MAEGSFSFLPELCKGPDVSEPLRAALNAVAWLNLANQTGREVMVWLVVEAQRAYAEAVGLLAGLLRDEEAARRDSTLATNFLFCLFEVFFLPICYL